jgi:N-formylglutamate amidohydrolase
MDQFKYNTEVSNPIFTYYPPLSPIKGFISIPHSGLDIPDEFHAYLAPDLLPVTSPDGVFLKTPINEDVDYAVDSLVNITALQEAGIAVIVAKIHRVCIDLNREPNIAVFSWEYNTQGMFSQLLFVCF